MSLFKLVEDEPFEPLASLANFFHYMPFPLIFLPSSPSINILTLKSFLISTPTPHSLRAYIATVYCLIRKKRPTNDRNSCTQAFNS